MPNLPTSTRERRRAHQVTVSHPRVVKESPDAYAATRLYEVDHGGGVRPLYTVNALFRAHTL